MHSESRVNILVISDITGWIISKMCNYIESHLGYDKNYNFNYASTFSTKYLDYYFKKQVDHSDIIICMTESLYESFHYLFNKDKTVYCWIHHITQQNKTIDFAINNCRNIITCTPTWKEKIIEVRKHDISDQEVFVVKHGIDSSVYFQSSNRHVDHKNIKIGYIGNIGSDLDNNRKGLDILFKVLIQLKKENKLQFEIIFAGVGWEKFAETLRANTIKARYIGYLPDKKLPDYYNSIDVLLITSRIEGGPYSVLEALSSGVPVISTQVGIVPEIIQNHKNGFHSKIDDSESIVENFYTLFKDETQYYSIKENTRKTVQNSSWDQVLTPLKMSIEFKSKLMNTSGQLYKHSFEKTYKLALILDTYIWIINLVRKDKSNLQNALIQLKNSLSQTSIIHYFQLMTMLLKSRVVKKF